MHGWLAGSGIIPGDSWSNRLRAFSLAAAMRILVLVALLFLATPSCTLCKPVVCAVTTPFLLLSESGSGPVFTCRNDGDGYAVVALLGVVGAVGAVVGLFTGIASDFNVLTGRVDQRHALKNLANPFRTNDG